jgi:hypothetical protein
MDLEIISVDLGKTSTCADGGGQSAIAPSIFFLALASINAGR